MRLLIVGSTGKTGKPLVRRALEEGHEGSGAKIGREDLAEFMLDLATGDDYIRQAPMVSY